VGESQDASGAPLTPNDPEDGADKLERTAIDPDRETLRQRIQRSRPAQIGLVILLLALLAAAATPGYLYFSRPHPTLATAKAGNIILTVKGQGTVQATMYGATFGVSGVVAELEAVPGQRVHAGDTLAALDTTAAKTALTDAQTEDSDAQSALTATQTEVTDAQTALTDAQTALSSAQTAQGTICGATTPNANACVEAEADVDEATAAASAAQARVDAAQARQAMAQVALDRAQGALDAAQTALAADTLVAPHAGIVLAVNGQVGDEFAADGTPFIVIADTGRPLVTVLIGYRDIFSIEPGENATLRVKQAPEATALSGAVYGFSLTPQGSGDNLAYPVTIAIDPATLKGGALLPGMSASATITTRSRTGVVIVPERAIVFARQAAPASGKGLLKASQISAALQEASSMEDVAVSNGFDIAHDPPQAAYLIGLDHGKYVAIPVVLGLSDGQNREIIAGVEPGDKIATGQSNPFFAM
jgi:HlyD family secretion protein